MTTLETQPMSPLNAPEISDEETHELFIHTNSFMAFDYLEDAARTRHRIVQEHIAQADSHNRSLLEAELQNDIAQDVRMFAAFNEDIEFRKSVYMLQATSAGILKGVYSEERKQARLQERIRQFIDETPDQWTAASRYLDHVFPMEAGLSWRDGIAAERREAKHLEIMQRRTGHSALSIAMHESSGSRDGMDTLAY